MRSTIYAPLNELGSTLWSIGVHGQINSLRFKSGYDDPYYFSRLFEKIQGNFRIGQVRRPVNAGVAKPTAA